MAEIDTDTDQNNYLVAIPILEKRDSSDSDDSNAYYECGRLKIGKGWKYVGLGAAILALVGFLIFIYVHFAFK
jgi:hypothetical protein